MMHGCQTLVLEAVTQCAQRRDWHKSATQLLPQCIWKTIVNLTCCVHYYFNVALGKYGSTLAKTVLSLLLSWAVRLF